MENDMMARTPTTEPMSAAKDITFFFGTGGNVDEADAVGLDVSDVTSRSLDIVPWLVLGLVGFISGVLRFT